MDVQNMTAEQKVKKPFYKKWWVWVIVVVVVLVIASSGSDEVQEDILNYSNSELTEIADLESEVYDLYENARENYTDDVTMYNTISNEVIPASQKLIDAAEEISPKTKEVREIHETYIAAVNTQHNAFTMMLSALENQDYAEVTEANSMLDEARKGMRDYVAALKELAEEHDVEFTGMED